MLYNRAKDVHLLKGSLRIDDQMRRQLFHPDGRHNILHFDKYNLEPPDVHYPYQLDCVHDK